MIAADTVTSPDGTRIAFWRGGSAGGPPLLLVHGAMADHSTSWRLVRPQLARFRTVYAMDRRGRGGSGDTAPYDLQREAEDVAAVVDAIGEQVDVLGHSYGALCTLEAALLTPHVRSLILYEGVALRGADVVELEVIERLESLLAAGDVEGMLIAMLREVARVPPKEIELLRAQRESWAVRVANAPTIPRELRTERGRMFEPARFATLRTPTLLLVGGDSPAREHENAKGVAAALPNAQVAVLAGHQHIAMFTAPEAFVAEVMRFLRPGGGDGA